MSRTILPTRRPAVTFTFSHGWQSRDFEYRCTIGYGEDGKIAELFLNAKKHDVALDANASEAAIFASIAIQHGVPFEVLRQSVKRDPRNFPSSPLGMALDEIARLNLDVLETGLEAAHQAGTVMQETKQNRLTNLVRLVLKEEGAKP